jgi:DNA polymerase III subunit alpha
MHQTDTPFDYRTELFDDPFVWDLIGSPNTTGLFQLGSSIYKKRMGRLKPRSIDELAACLALLRGPCISSGLDEIYMEIIAGDREVELIHPVYDKVTAATKGVILYQEQLMELATGFGLTLEDGYALMKTISKKNQAKINKEKEKYLARITDLDMDTATFERIWKIVYDMGQYSFGLNHACAYSLLTYASAVAKIYCPLHFMANLLTNTYEKNSPKIDQELSEILRDCRRQGIKFLPVDVNKSNWRFTVEGANIRIGFCAVTGFGEKASRELTSKRPFVSTEDALDRLERRCCTVTALTTLAFAEGFAPFEPDSITSYHKVCFSRKKEVPQDIKIGKANLNLSRTSPVTFRKHVLGVEYPMTA